MADQSDLSSSAVVSPADESSDAHLVKSTEEKPSMTSKQGELLNVVVGNLGIGKQSTVEYFLGEIEDIKNRLGNLEQKATGANKVEVGETKEKVQGLCKKLTELQEQEATTWTAQNAESFQNLNKKVIELQKKIDEKSAEIEQMRKNYDKQLQEKCGEIEKLNKELNERKNEVQWMDEKIKKSEQAEIKNKDEINRRDTLIQKQLDLIDKKCEEMESMKNELEQKNEEIERMKMYSAFIEGKFEAGSQALMHTNDKLFGIVEKTSDCHRLLPHETSERRDTMLSLDNAEPHSDT